MADEHTQMRLAPGLDKAQMRDLNEAAWGALFVEIMKRNKIADVDLRTKPLNQPWKLKIAQELRSQGVAVGWLTQKLHLGSPNSVRSYLCRHENQQTAA